MPTEIEHQTEALPLPWRVVGAVLAIVFGAEVVVMLLLPLALPGLAGMPRALADAALLTVIVSPTLWWSIVRPLRAIAAEQRRREATVLAHAADAVLTVDEDQRIEAVNPSAERLFGADAPQLVGRKLGDFIRGLPENLQQAVRLGEAEFEGVRTDDERFPLEASFGGFDSRSGWRAIVVARDLTERRRSEGQLRILGRAVEQSPSAVVITDADGDIQYVNPQFEIVTGYTAAEAIGQNPRILKSERHPPEFYADMWQTILEGETWRGEICNRRKDGTYYWEFAAISAVRDAAGETTNYVAVKEDITDRKLAEGRLRRAKEVAESAARAKSDFLANMSHEIRTPMNAVIGMAELALETELTPEQREYVDTIRDSGEALLTIINDILDFSKIEAGHMELETTPFALRDCIEGSLKPLAVRAHEKGLELVVRVSPSAPLLVVGDPVRLRQVLLNLVGNAIKFTAEGEVVVDVDVDEQTADEVRLHIQVRDTGIGIPQDKQRAIFESFAQADASTTRQFGGTGLGLSIVAALTKMMHGRAWVESPAPANDGASRGGPGSVFHITPVVRIADEQPPVIPSLDGQALIVDSNATSRAVTAELLESWGLLVLDAAHLEDALALLREADEESSPFGLAVVDAGLLDNAPGDSLEEWVRRTDCPMVVTRHIRAGGAAPWSASPAVRAIVTKPVCAAPLRAAVEQCLDADADGARWCEPIDADSLTAIDPQRRLSILLADDHPVNQRVAVAMLEKRGHRVTVAADGQQAIDAWESEPFDLVLMDVQMPVMNGFEATAEIRRRESESGRHTPIVALTAHAMAGDRERCLSAGMDAYLSKPIRPTEVANLINRLISGAALLPADAKEEPRQTVAGSASFDLAETLDRVEDDIETLCEVIELFLRDLPGRMDGIQQAIHGGHSNDLAYAAHTLKGSASMFSAHEVCRLSESLEAAAHDEDFTRARELWGELTLASAMLDRDLREFVAAHADSFDAANP